MGDELTAAKLIAAQRFLKQVGAQHSDHLYILPESARAKFKGKELPKNVIFSKFLTEAAVARHPFALPLSKCEFEYPE